MAAAAPIMLNICASATLQGRVKWMSEPLLLALSCCDDAEMQTA